MVRGWPATEYTWLPQMLSVHWLKRLYCAFSSNTFLTYRSNDQLSRRTPADRSNS